MVHNHDHAGVKGGGGAKLGSPPPLVAPLKGVIGKTQIFQTLRTQDSTNTRLYEHEPLRTQDSTNTRLYEQKHIRN